MAHIQGLSNSQLINKAAITSGSFTGSIGLGVDEANTFIDYVVDQSFLKNNARVERMNSATKKIDFTNLGGRVLKPAVAATDPGNTVSHAMTQISLEAKEMIAIAEISDDSLEDNKEGDAFVDHLMSMVAKSVGNELEEAFLMGRRIENPAAATNINQLFNGWIKRAYDGGHVVNAQTFTDRYISNAKLSKLVKALPTQYRRDRNSLRTVIADDIYQDYIDVVGARLTNLGDVAHQGLLQLKYGNILLQEMSSLPTEVACPVVGGGSTTTTAPSIATATTLAATAVTDFAVGDVVAVGYQTGFQEIRTITDITDLVVTLDTALEFAHATGTTIREITEDGTFGFLTDYRNLIVGFHRDIRVETERHARKRSTSFVLTLRADVQMENPDAVAILENLKVQ